MSADKGQGPRLTLEASCFDCAYERSDSYRAQGDSGHDVFCDHPANPGKRIGDTTWATPVWCPLLAGRKATFAAALLAGEVGA